MPTRMASWTPAIRASSFAIRGRWRYTLAKEGQTAIERLGVGEGDARRITRPSSTGAHPLDFVRR